MENKEKVRKIMKNQGKVMDNDEKVRKIMKNQRKILENEEKVRKNEGKPMKHEGKVMENKEKVRKPCPKKKQEKKNKKKTAPYIYIYIHWLVVSNMFLFFHSVGNVIIPTDEEKYFSEGSGSTTNQYNIAVEYGNIISGILP